MDKAIHTVAPYFDPGELREELATVANAAGDATKARGIITDRLKSLVDEARNAARAGLEADREGLAARGSGRGDGAADRRTPCLG